MSRELIIPFESFNERGIQKRIISNVEKSFFYNIYMQAFQLIEQIDKTNGSKTNKNSTKHCDDSQNKLNDFQNVIAFTGRRGTGKTSSMLSFMDTLVKGEFKDEYFKKEIFNFINKGFYAIPYTDASLMSKNEDIFETVLSKMLSCAQREYKNNSNYRYSGNNELEIKKISEKICDIYNDYSSLKYSKDFSASAPYNLMEKLAEKHNVREKFIELVEEFTDVLNNFYDKKIDYLIICIDDIDMTQNNHMDIMQCIHQYFMIPRVIVLVSFNIPMLTATLQANFYSNVSISNSRDEEHNHQMYMTRNQTYDFMRKIIPADMRINMPSWKKKDYRELFPIQIDFSNKEIIEKLFIGITKCNFYNRIIESKKKLVTPKELIMLMLADRTSIYLDICGFKLHFMQPDSLRELSDLFYLIYNMKFCNNKEEEKDKLENENGQKRRENRKVLLDYLHFKMLPENNFPYEISRFIDDVLSSPIERRGRIIWDYYFKLLSNDENCDRVKKIYNKNFYDEEIKRFNVEKFSLGSLYRTLYSATRLNVLDRKVVIFLLASFSFSVPQFVEEEKKEKENDENYSCKRLREAFRYSLIGTWRQNLFSGKEKKTVSLFINKNKLKNYKDITDVDKLRYIIYSFMLSSCSALNKIKDSSVDSDINKFKLEIDPTAFIVNSYAFDHRMKKTMLELKNGETKNIMDYIIDLELGKEEESKSLYNIIKKELTNFDYIPDFLLKHTDLSYSVIKRVMSEMVYSSDNDVSSTKEYVDKKPLDIIKDFYQKLSAKLQDQDKGYLNTVSESKGRSFEEKFGSNPIVSLFLGEDADKLKDMGIEFVLETDDTEDKKNDGQTPAKDVVNAFKISVFW